MEWGYVRLHPGVDRARCETHAGVPDAVVVPFDAARSNIVEYGDTSYGTLTSLFVDAYQFEFRIGHMNPDQNKRKANEQGPILEWSYERLKRKKSFMRNWILGSAGSLGFSSGAHTHTEVKSYDDSAEVLDILLTEKYGKDTEKDYDLDQVIAEYRKHEHYKNASADLILDDYNELRKKKRVILLNQYKYQYVDYDNKVRTRYSTEYLFGV
jgi:hypothetical protein